MSLRLVDYLPGLGPAVYGCQTSVVSRYASTHTQVRREVRVGKPDMGGGHYRHRVCTESDLYNL